MFKAIFEFLTEPLGLPIDWYWEYIILAIIGLVAYKIAYSIVGNMYRIDLISGRTAGSFFHWIIRLSVFTIIWVSAYVVIWLWELIRANLQTTFLVLGIVGVCTLIILWRNKIKYNKGIDNDAHVNKQQSTNLSRDNQSK